MQMFPGFFSPKNDLWYAAPDSDDNAILSQIMTVVPLEDQEAYRKQFEQFMTTFKSMSAALFRQWETSRNPDPILNIVGEVMKLGRTGYYATLNKKKGTVNFQHF